MHLRTNLRASMQRECPKQLLNHMTFEKRCITPSYNALKAVLKVQVFQGRVCQAACVIKLDICRDAMYAKNKENLQKSQISEKATSCSVLDGGITNDKGRKSSTLMVTPAQEILNSSNDHIS